VFCVHGSLDHGASWERVAAPLARRGLRVIAPDLRGHGRSEHARPGSSYHLLDLLGDLDGLLTSLGERRPVLVSHSFGGALAALLAAARPKRLAGLVLVEPPAFAAQAGGLPIERLAGQLDAMAEPQSHPVLRDIPAAAARLRRSMPGLDEAWALRMAERLTEPCVGGVCWRWDPAIRGRAGLVFDGLFAAASAGHWLNRLPSPTIVVFGDGIDSAASRAPAGLSLPGARLVTLHGGHALHIDAPEALAGLIYSVAT
jgi:pimeloyl-ACP methyl ester carboxylesterase